MELFDKLKGIKYCKWCGGDSYGEDFCSDDCKEEYNYSYEDEEEDEDE